MSDDEFGDFAEAAEEIKYPEPEIAVDSFGRPLDYLPSVWNT